LKWAVVFVISSQPSTTGCATRSFLCNCLARGEDLLPHSQYPM